jgi:hypothetical protein
MDKVIENVPEVAEENATTTDNIATELIVELKPESYEKVLLTAQRAKTRGMDDSFQVWLAKVIDTGFRTIHRVWDTADANNSNKALKILIAQALDGSKTAIAKLHEMGLDVVPKA